MSDERETAAGSTGSSPLIWHDPVPTPLKEEGIRARILEKPERLPWIKEGARAMTRELAVPRAGFADLVVVGSGGEITIVECKLGKNAGFRRRIIGQLFSYAGGLWGLPFTKFAELFAAAEGPDATLTEPLASSRSWEPEKFEAAVTANLQAGAFTLVFAVDVLTQELEQTVRFLDRLTLPQLRLRVVICGPSAEAVRRVPTAKKLDKDALVAAIGSRQPRAEAPALELLEWIEVEGFELDYTEQDAVVFAPSGERLWRIVGHEEKLRVSMHRVRKADAAQAEKLKAALEDLGFEFSRRHAEAPLLGFAEKPKKLAEFERRMRQAHDLLG